MPEEKKENIYEVVFKQTLDFDKEVINTSMVSGAFIGDEKLIEEMGEAYKKSLIQIKKEQGGE